MPKSITRFFAVKGKFWLTCAYIGVFLEPMDHRSPTDFVCTIRPDRTSLTGVSWSGRFFAPGSSNVRRQFRLENVGSSPTTGAFALLRGDPRRNLWTGNWKARQFKRAAVATELKAAAEEESARGSARKGFSGTERVNRCVSPQGAQATRPGCRRFESCRGQWAKARRVDGQRGHTRQPRKCDKYVA